MSPTREAWARAFAQQARSDWAVYKVLAQQPTLPRCHGLHYLQMASEKIAKAYRCRDTNANVDDVLSSHVGFEKFVNSFLLSPTMKEEYAGRRAQLRELLKTARLFAREIEKLAPAVDRIHAPENAEYPWARGEEVVTPCDYDYPALSLLTTSRGRTFLNFLARAICDFELIQL
jgi:hypothetical protein